MGRAKSATCEQHERVEVLLVDEGDRQGREQECGEHDAGQGSPTPRARPALPRPSLLQAPGARRPATSRAAWAGGPTPSKANRRRPAGRAGWARIRAARPGGGRPRPPRPERACVPGRCDAAICRSPKRPPRDRWESRRPGAPGARRAAQHAKPAQRRRPEHESRVEAEQSHGEAHRSQRQRVAPETRAVGAQAARGGIRAGRDQPVPLEHEQAQGNERQHQQTRAGQGLAGNRSGAAGRTRPRARATERTGASAPPRRCRGRPGRRRVIDPLRENE